MKAKQSVGDVVGKWVVLDSLAVSEVTSLSPVVRAHVMKDEIGENSRKNSIR